MAEPWQRLPAVFTYADGKAFGITKHRIYAVREQGVIEALSRGLYHRLDRPIDELELVAETLPGRSSR